MPLSPAETPRALPPGRFSAWLAALTAASLLGNAALAGWFVAYRAGQNRRLDRLEAAAAANRPRVRTAARGRADPAVRIAALLAVAGDPERSRRLLDGLTLDECLQAAQALADRPAANDRNAALGAVADWVANADPARAITLLGGLPASALKTHLAEGVLTVWMGNQPDAAARWLADQGGQLFTDGQIERQLAPAMTRWSAFDPAAAARFLVAQPPGARLGPPRSTELLNQACLDWARQDLPRALAWAQSLAATDPARLPVLRGLLSGWAEQDPVQAAGYTRQLLYGGGSGHAFLAGIVAERWTDRDPTAAAQWAATLPDPAAREDALRTVAARWVRTDAPGASRWAGALPDDRGRLIVWRTLAESWAEGDDAGEAAWLGGLPAGRERDRALAVYVGRVARGNPEKALTWARTLSDGPFAAEQLDRVLRAWEVQDLPSARNWAAANGMTLPTIR